MKHWFIYCSLLLISAHCSVAQSPHRSNWDFCFPLDIKPVVSGSFGEIRSNHFHSGLDLGTNGKTGLPVFAADQGFVARISVSPIGFGKAIYIEHPSGYTTVYAHLDRFNTRFDSVVTALQYQKESFSLQHYFKPGTFPVKRGELIAFSGNSGSSGGPHLHFEVRQTLDERPIDPLSFNTPVEDDVRPQITGIQLYPLSPGGTINGHSSPQYFPVVFYNGAFHLKSNPRIKSSGTIGVGIEVLDYYSDSWRKCGIHSITLHANNDLAFQFTMDGFLFSQTRYLNSHIDYAEKITHRRTIQKSFLDPFNLLDLYQTNSERGRIRINPGASLELSYEVSDISGNASQLRFSVEGTALAQPAAMDDLLNKRSLIKAGKPFVFEQEGYAVAFPPESFYGDIPASFEMVPCSSVLQGKALKVLDETVPVHSYFEITIPVDPALGQRGLTGALVMPSGKLVAAGGGIRGTDFVIQAREGGLYGLTRDTVPPSIRLVSPPVNLNYRGRKSLIVNIDDDFSGISHYQGRINGKWTLFEYDAKTNRLECLFNKVPFLKKGENKLEILINDGVGNEKQYVAVFKY